MANEGRNILEAVLNGDIASKFNKVDTAVETIQKHMDMASESAKNLANEFANLNEVLGKSFNAEGATQYIDKILQLTNTLGGFGATTTRVATESVDNINEITRALQQLYKDKLNLEGKMTGMEIKSLGKESVSVEVLEIYQKLKRELDEVNRKIEETSKKLDDNGEAAQKAYDVQKVRQTIALEIKRSDAIDKTNAAIEKMNQKMIGLGGGAKPQTIEQYRIAIKNLKRELEQLAPTNKTGIDAINSKIKEYQKLLDVATEKQRKFSLSMNGLTDSAKRLASTFGVMLSVQGLINFATNIRDVTGEFELQHRALQAIIGDMDEANKLWDKTIRLAVKSPYSVKELVTYTKQLAAYRIETEKLYDTTKMLADISSGLGVDMQRLILAYGQVKAANYLRGQELRQFSEAGINILGGLADYFSELQNRAISTADVFDMVSKRMVKFEDVAEVLKRMTQEGGIFFNMQEIQAETLKGMMMNLKDSFDIMRNEIGEGSRGLFVSMISATKYLVDNWKSVHSVLKLVLGLVISFKIAQISAAAQMLKTGVAANVEALAMGRLSSAMVGVIAGMNGAKTATIGFSTAIKNIPVIGWILAAISAIIGVVRMVRSEMAEAKELENELSKIQIENATSTNKMVNQYNALANKIRDVNTTEKERNEALQKMQRLYSDILPQRMLEIEYITKEGNAYNDARQAIIEYYQEKRRQQQIDAVEAKYGQELTDAQSKLAKGIQDTLETYYDVKVSLSDINAAIDEFRKRVESGTMETVGYNSELNRLIKIQTGIKQNAIALLNYDWWYNTTLGDLNDYVSALSRYNNEMNDVTSQSGRFGASLEKIFEDFRDSFGELKVPADITGTLTQNLENQSKAVVDYYKNLWSEFQKTTQYAMAKGFYDNYFEIKIKPLIDNAEFSNVENAVSKKIDEIAAKYADKGIYIDELKDLAYDDAKTVKQYLDDVLKPAYENMALIVREYEAGLSRVSQEEYDRSKRLLPIYKELYEWINAVYNPKKAEPKALNKLNKQIDLIKRLNAEYKKYVDLGVKDPFAKTKEDMQSEIDELELTQWVRSLSDFKDETVVKAFENSVLTPMVDAAGQAGKMAAAKFKSGYDFSIDKDKVKKAKTELKKSLDDMLEGYNIWKDIQKMGFGKEVALTFGVDTSSLEDIKNKLAQLFTELGGDFTAKDGELYKWYQEQLAKISQMEDKEQVERLKTYLEYTKKGLNERAKIIYNGLRGLAEIEKAYQIEIEKAQKEGNESQVARLKAQKETIIANYKEITEQQLASQTFKEFKGSDMYLRFFGELDNVSSNVLKKMRTRLEDIKKSLGESPTELKAVSDEILKIDDILSSRSPWKNFMDNYDEVLGYMKEKGFDSDPYQSLGGIKDFKIAEGMYADTYTTSSELLTNLQAISSEYNAIISHAEETGSIDEERINKINELVSAMQQQGLISAEVASRYKADSKSTIEGLKTQKTAVDAGATSAEEAVEESGKALKAFGKMRKNITDFSKDWKTAMNSVKSASDTIVDNLDIIGGETNNTSKAFGAVLDSIYDILGALPMYVAQMIAAGATVNASLGIIGLIAEAISLVIALIKALANLNDAQAEDNIESIQKQVDALKDKYDELEKAFKRAWNVEDMLHYRQEMKRTLSQQAEYYRQMAAAESSKKKADQDKINEYYKKAKEAEDAIKEMEEDFIEALGGIGKDNYRSAAQEFVDSWYDAFKETGDGLDGLTEHFEEVLVNMIKKQAMMRIAQRYLQPLFDMIDSSIDTDGKITVSEMNLIRQKIQETMPQLNEALKDFFESLGELGGIGEGLSGLQEGIQGVTEETAEVVAAYLNSLRLFVSQTTVDVGRIAEILSTTSGTINPMLGELKLIKERMDDTYNFLYNRREGGNGSIQVSIVN